MAKPSNSNLPTTSRWSKIWSLLRKRRGDRNWDLFVRGSGVVGLLGIPITLLWGNAIPLVWFGLLTVPANSVVSPLIPISFEVLIIEAAKYTSTLAITIVGTAVFLYMEYLNWHIYRWIFEHKRLGKLREDRWIQRSVGYFRRSPFITVVIFSFTPLPFWAARAVAVLDDYSLRRFMIATAIGRAPRIAVYAWLGSMLQVPSLLLVLGLVGTIALVIAARRSKPPVRDVSTELDAYTARSDESLICAG